MWFDLDSWGRYLVAGDEVGLQPAMSFIRARADLTPFDRLALSPCLTSERGKEQMRPSRALKRPDTPSRQAKVGCWFCLNLGCLQMDFDYLSPRRRCRSISEPASPLTSDCNGLRRKTSTAIPAFLRVGIRFILVVSIERGCGAGGSVEDDYPTDRGWSDTPGDDP